MKFPTDCEGLILSTQNLLDSLPDHSLPDIFTSIIQSSQEEKLQVLDAKDLDEVIRLALPLLLRQIEVSTVKNQNTVLLIYDTVCVSIMNVY